jgi:flagellar biosynthetic protein FliR
MNADWLLQQILPYMLLLARVSAFLIVLPIFGWQALPTIVRAGLAVTITFFFAMSGIGRIDVDMSAAGALEMALLTAREIACGLALGLAVQFVFLAVQQAGNVMAMQMGFADAGILDPTMGEETSAITTLMEMSFALLFLAAGGHYLLMQILQRSMAAFPLGGPVDFGALAEGLVQAGATMLLLALKLAGPVLAGFLLLSLVLGVLARVLPEMNVLTESFPLRVALGFLMASVTLPSLERFGAELGGWLNQFLIQ